jgi:RNA polymerase sigma factor (sigma-70 family)
MPSTRRLAPFDRVVDEHGADLWRFCVSQVGRERAEDLFQETMLAALTAYPSLREPSRVRPWLLRIAARNAIDHFRASSRAPVPVPDPASGVADEAEPPQRDDELWRQVRELPPKQRQAVALRFVLDLKYAEIGEAMATSPEAARRNVYEGLERLRAEISRSEPPARHVGANPDPTGART